MPSSGVSSAKCEEVEIQRFSREMTGYMAWNLVGLILPLPIGLVALPFIATHLGEYRFGLLSAVWAITGYFSLFDLGVGRALTRELSAALRHSEARTVTELVHTATTLSLTLGLVGAAVLCLASPLISQVLDVGGGSRIETLWTVVAASTLLPGLLLAAVAQGIMESLRLFRGLAWFRITLTTATYVVPVAILPLSSNVATIVVALAIARVLVLATGWVFLTRRDVPAFGFAGSTRKSARDLLAQGAWMTVSGVVSPILTFLDRWFVAVLVSVSALGYYTVPMELGQRLLVIAAGIAGVLFPLFAREGGNSTRTLTGYRQSLGAIIVLVVPITFIVGCGAEELLRVWVGDAFAREGATTLRIVAVGILTNSAARVPFTLLQSAGKSRLTAAIHLAELPVYLIIVWQLTKSYGLAGAAAAWTIRVTIDLICMLIAAGRITSELASACARVGGVVTLVIGCYMSSMALGPGPTRVLAAVGSMAVITLATWFAILRREDRTLLLGWRRRQQADMGADTYSNKIVDRR